LANLGIFWLNSWFIQIYFESSLEYFNVI